MSIIISNSSPLIGLCKINQLNIIKELWNEIIIPESVYKEVVINGKGKIGADVIEIACNEWIKVVSVKNKQEVDALNTILDEGESEVIALGQELKASLLLLDNREPRLFARTINKKVMGTVGVITFAWKKGMIKDPVNELYKLRYNGFWINDKLIERVKMETK